MATMVEVFQTFCEGAYTSKLQIVYIQDAMNSLYGLLPKSKAGVMFHLQLETMVELEQVEGFGKHMQIFCHGTTFEPRNMGQVILRSKLACAGGFFMGTTAMQATALTLPHDLMASHDIVHAQWQAHACTAGDNQQISSKKQELTKRRGREKKYHKNIQILTVATRMNSSPGAASDYILLVINIQTLSGVLNAY
jgi:hypothetical protein